MNRTIERNGREKKSEGSIKGVSMEEKSPTMLDVAFLRLLQIIRKGSAHQGILEHALLKGLTEEHVYSHCLSSSFYRHGYFTRMV